VPSWPLTGYPKCGTINAVFPPAAIERVFALGVVLSQTLHFSRWRMEPRVRRGDRQTEWRPDYDVAAGAANVVAGINLSVRSRAFLNSSESEA
jgi:hypothetical protein